MRKLHIIAALTFAVIGSTGIYAWQRNVLHGLQRQGSKLQAQSASLQKQFAGLKAASSIDTSSWKRFCDPQINLCFKYPADWTFASSTAAQFGYLGADVTNPSKTVRISYIEPLTKDSSYNSEHIVSIDDLQIGTTKLKLIGSYPIASGTYHPSFTIASVSASAELKPGTIGFGTVNPRFDVDQYQSISFQGLYVGKAMTSNAQAEAWFKSVDGKAARAIMASLSTQ